MSDQYKQWAEAGLDFEVVDGLAKVTFNRVQVRNAVDRPLRKAILEALSEINLVPEIRAALFTGAGTAFCSGADLGQVGGPHEMLPEHNRGTEVHQRREDGLEYGWWRVIEKVWENKKPIITAVNGAAYGFGCNFALASDIVIAAESARFCEIFVQRGLPLEASGAYILTRSISPVRAKELALYGDPLSGEKAAEWGLVNRCVPDAELMDVATDWARRLAVGPTIGIGHIKSQINQGLDQNIRQTWRDEVTYLGMGIGADGTEAMTAFQERRQPVYKGL